MKICFKTFGCRVNQVETQALLEQCAKRGMEISDDISRAAVCVVNSCTVTANADRDAVKFIRMALKKNPACRIMVTGCLATRDPRKIISQFPYVELVPNKSKSTIPELLCKGASVSGNSIFPGPSSHPLIFPVSPSTRLPVPHSSLLEPDHFIVTGFHGHTRAFMKVQDGCDTHCAYCVVPSVRPVKFSKPLNIAKKELEGLVKKGFKEIVVCGIRLGAYKCPETGAELPVLLKEMCHAEGDFRIRFSSLESGEIDAKLVEEAVKAGDKFCHHFHIPLQSGSDKVLKDMGRPYNIADYGGKIKMLQEAFPNLGLYADVIAGYPTESEKNFSESYDYIIKAGFSGLHVFSYSKREGTRAEKLGTLPGNIVKSRSAKLRALDAALRVNFAKSLIGTVQTVLLEEKDSGVASNFQRVVVGSHKGQAELVKVKIKKAEKNICYA